MPAKDFGHYRTLRPLGRGGMGEVHLAEDLRLGRNVAIKFLAEDLLREPTALRRFEVEARAVAALSHAHIATIHDLGTHEQRPYLVFEYVDGESLDRRIATGPLPVEEALRIAIAVAEGLEHAHRHGITHRDIKSSNVMLGREGEVKILDFGLALMDEATRLTQEKTAVGTVHYMSPEQLRGGAIDARSDIWSLGVLLYEMLAGTTPFARSTAAATFQAIDSQPTPAISGRRSGIPLEIEHILGKCLEKDPQQRYQHADELAVDLRAVARVSDGVATSPPRTRRRRWIGIAFAGLALTALAGVMFRRGSEAAVPFDERDWILVARFENGTGDTDFDQSLGAAFRISLQQSQYVNVFPHSRVESMLARMQREPSQPLDEDLSKEIALRASIPIVVVPAIHSVGDVQVLSAKLVDPNSGVALRTVSSRAEKKNHVLGALDALARDVRTRLGESLDELGPLNRPLPELTTASLEALQDFARAERAFGSRQYVEAENLFRAAIERDSTFALAHARLGVSLCWRGDVLAGEKSFRRALALKNRLSDRERLYLLPMIEGWRDNREAAVSGYRTYLNVYPDDSDAWHSLGYQLSQLRRCEEAEEAFGHLLAIIPEEAAAYINMATCRTMGAEYDRAITQYEEAFRLRPDWRISGNLNHEYGNALIGAHRNADARATFDLMLERNTEDRASGLRSHALLDMWEGRYLAATDALRECIRLCTGLNFPLSVLRNRCYLATVDRRLEHRADWNAQMEAADKILDDNFFGVSWAKIVAVEWVRGGRSDRARELLATMRANASESRAQDRADIARVEGEIALAEGDPAAALAAMEEAAAVDHSSSQRLALGRSLLAAGRVDDGREELEEVLSGHLLGWELQEEAIDGILLLIALAREQERWDDVQRWTRGLSEQWAAADSEFPARASLRDAEQALRARAGR